MLESGFLVRFFTSGWQLPQGVPPVNAKKYATREFIRRHPPCNPAVCRPPAPAASPRRGRKNRPECPVTTEPKERTIQGLPGQRENTTKADFYDMARPKELTWKRLRAVCNPETIPYADTNAAPEPSGPLSFQPRALSAMRLGLAVGGGEYNIFVAGSLNLGRTYFVRTFLEPLAAKAPTPPDILYLYNFEDPDKPVTVQLPAGKGRAFKNALSKAMQEIRKEIPARFEHDTHLKKHEALIKEYQIQRENLFDNMEKIATDKCFNLDMDDQGALLLTPLLDGKPVSQEDFESLDPDTRKSLKTLGDELLGRMTGHLRELHRREDDFKREEMNLYRQTAERVLGTKLAPLKKRFAARTRLPAYFKAMAEDILDNIDLFMPRESVPGPPPHPGDHSPLEDLFARYEANLFVDNSRLSGAPIVVEDHPTHFNLLGCIERESEMGAVFTGYSLIKAGALHKANHGFLILNVEDVLANPHSWEGLLRALRTGKAKIEDPGEPDQVRAKTIEPEPMDLRVKVILTGSDEMYETLLYGDDRFAKFFKLTAHLQDTCPRNAANVRRYIQILAKIVREAGLLPLEREALAGLVEISSRLAEDQKKLTLHFPLIRERMIEASAHARMRGKKIVDREALRASIDDRIFRSNLFEAEFMSDYDREIIKVATGGQAVGRANGLSVSLFGDYEVGLPHQISCTIGVGHGGILDLEREAQLGGPIHTKGMMIIKGYLLGLFARDKPIVLTGNLAFEQSYAGIEGDSASGAELAALLSALADVPINLAYAFTGAVSQSGTVMAVGGVSRKIEGFFEVCRRRGLSGKQGVILPCDNVSNLMLREEVVDAVRQGKFHIFPVKTIDQAMEILTGMRTGTRGANGSFPAGTLYKLIDARLAAMAELARKSGMNGYGNGRN